MKNNMRDFEDKLINGLNIDHVAGIDEVGRGPLAGPVVVCAVILPKDYNNSRIDDSKKLSPSIREELYSEILKNAISYSVIETSAQDIDKYNILNATVRSMEKAVNSLSPSPQFILTDHVKIKSDIPQLNLVKGDSRSISIAAASIVAKVYRDRLMKELSEKFPEYGWNRNMGYGTREHIHAINTFGWTIHHRKTFEPVKSMMQGNLF